MDFPLGCESQFHNVLIISHSDPRSPQTGLILRILCGWEEVGMQYAILDPFLKVLIEKTGEKPENPHVLFSQRALFMIL